MNAAVQPTRSRDPERTREKILDAAQALILGHGFGSTTVDAVVARAGITKGAFFHHFASKSDLGRALVERYDEQDRRHLEEQIARARKLSDDPLQQVLIVLGLYQEEFEAMEAPFPGCLLASYIYQVELLDEQTRQILVVSAERTRRVFREMLERAAAAYPPRVPVDLDSLADLFYVMPEGSFVMTKTLGDARLFGRHTEHLRHYLRLLFAPEPGGATRSG